jgi:5-carboxymethyl-2-hydroxymuconate isomerase
MFQNIQGDITMKYAVLDGSRFKCPIGKILCIGRNYVDHIKELGNETPAAPVLFMKPSSSVIEDGEQIVIPPYSNDCHHEAELALLIGKDGRNIPADQVSDYIAGFGVAIDLTLRDVQSEQKKKGLPWEIAKGFDTACPLSSFISADRVKDPQNLNVRLMINGEEKQNGSTSLMIHSIMDLVSYMSGIFTLEAGDVILTGTPAGVGVIKSGDDIIAEVDQVARLQVKVA